jgi:hypothetical protein
LIPHFLSLFFLLEEKTQEEEAPAKKTAEETTKNKSDGQDNNEEADDEEETGSVDTNPQDSHTTDAAVEDITSNISNMSVVDKPAQQKFSMDAQFPFICYDYLSKGRRRVSVDFLIMTVSKDMVRPKMAANGLELHVGVAVPSFFADENRLMTSNDGDPGFTEDTHKATAFKEAATKLHEHYQSFDEEEIIGAVQRIKLPFKCEENIVDWEMLAFENEDTGLTDGLGPPQFYFVLSVDLVSTIKPREKKKKGGFRVISSPSRAAADSMFRDDFTL